LAFPEEQSHDTNPRLSPPGWKQCLVEYLDANARHATADRLMSRAERIFDKLSRKGVKDERAYTLAGVGLADERSVRAYQEKMRAFERLCLSLKTKMG
jgi:hypothetical protein